MKKLKPLLLLLVCFLFAAGFRGGLHRWMPSVYNAIWGATAGEKPAEKLAVATVPKEDEKGKSTDTVARADAPEIWATGAVRFRNRVLVQMSDGTVRTDLDNTPAKGDVPAVERLTKVTSTFADWDGKRYWYRPSPSVARLEGVAADRRPLDPASEASSPNGRPPVDGGVAPAVASGPLVGGL